MATGSLPSLSIVIPVRNEAPNIRPLADEIDAALGSHGEWECLWVDDASTDDTADRLVEVLAGRPHHRVVTLFAHGGQTAAFLIGWQAARGEFVAGLDGDLQNDPADIPRLLALAVEGNYDLVNGVRLHRQDGWVRRVSSRLANGFRNWVTSDTTTDVGCSVRVFRRSFVAAIPPYRGMHRFLPTFIRLAGGRIAEAPVAHRPRLAGIAKYGVHNRLWVGLADTVAVRWVTRRFTRLDELTRQPTAPAIAECPSMPPTAWMLPSGRRPPPSLAGWMALALLALGLAFAFQGTRGLWDPDEGRYAECAREMLQSGDFLVPRLGGEPHFTKPPLTYWSIALSMALFGPNEWAVRLYLSLAFAATVLLVAALGARLWGERTGLLAGLIYATSLLPFTAAGIATPDTLLTLWEALALYAFWRGWSAESKAERRWWPAVTGAAFGLAFLTKGPPGLLFLPVMFLFRRTAAGRREGAAPLFNVAGLALFLGIGLSWYLAVLLRQPGLLDYFLRDEVVGRIAGQHHRNEQWYGPIVIYGPAFLLGTLPWIFFVPGLRRRMASHGKGQWNPGSTGSDPRTLFLVGIIVLPLVVFTLARSRLPLYVLPLFVPIALLLARSLLAGKPEVEPIGVRVGELLRHRGAPPVAAWVALLIAGRLLFAHWPGDQDARRLYRSLQPTDGIELVVGERVGRYGLSFYAHRDVEYTVWEPRADGSSRQRGIEDEVNEVSRGDRNHLFLVRKRDEAKLNSLLLRAGVSASRRDRLGDLTAVHVEP